MRTEIEIFNEIFNTLDKKEITSISNLKLIINDLFHQTNKIYLDDKEFDNLFDQFIKVYNIFEVIQEPHVMFSTQYLDQVNIDEKEYYKNIIKYVDKILVNNKQSLLSIYEVEELFFNKNKYNQTVLTFGLEAVDLIDQLQYVLNFINKITNK